MKNMMGTMLMSKRTRRSHSLELKAEVLNACELGGTSVAEVARHYGLNANLVQTWRRQARQSPVVPELPAAAFVPVVCSEQREAAEPMRLVIRYRGAEISLECPDASATACAHWLRTLLR